MDKNYLTLQRAWVSRPSGQWSEDDYDVVADSRVAGRILRSAAAPVGTPWFWTLAYSHLEDRTPTHGYEPTREAAMAAFAKSWRRQLGPPCRWRGLSMCSGRDGASRCTGAGRFATGQNNCCRSIWP